MGNQKNIRNMSNRMLPLSFPPSKSALWDSAPMGDPIGLHFSYYRNPRVLLSEKALRLAYRHAKTERKLFSCFLMSNFYIDEDEEGITLSIDRFDPGREKMGSLAKVPSALLPEDFVIPCSIGTGEGPTNGLVHTPENLTSSFKGLQSHLHSKEALDLSKLLTVRARITYTENMDNLHFDVHWAAVAVANTFESTPIKPVPIIPTALARNLSSHNNIAQLQGTHKCGYLTMDQTRKLLLVLESDPKVYMLPLVGIWVSGVTHIHSPQVWAICLRYMFSSSVNERVLSESGAFLIVLYSLTHKEPEFYECTPCVSHDPLSFQLLTCEDALHLFKDVEVSRNPLKFELTSECQDSEAILFKETCKSKENFLVSAGRPFNSFNSSSRQASSPEKLLKSDHDSGVEDEDFSPRPSPRPHPSVQQVTRIHPSVPELSLVFGSFFDSKTPSHTTEKKNNTPLSSTPHIVNGALEYVSKPVEQQQLYENQSNDSNLKQQNPAKATTIKPYKGKYSPDECQPCPMQVRRNSATTTSIHSTQKLSPDSSMQQIKVSSEQDQTDNRSGQIHCSGPDTLRRSLLSNSWPTTSSNYPNHNVTFPLQTRHVTEGPKPLHQGNIHNCCHSTVKCHSLIPFHAFENPPEPCESVIPTFQNVACPSMCCSPIHLAGCQQNNVKTEFCSPPVDPLVLSPGRRESMSVNACSPHSCRHTPSPITPSASGMLGLSTEAYRLLAEQDKQLKLLQSQIQRLLEAQATHSESKTNSSKLKQTESEPTRSKSVSIAVGTGASLFWNPPCPLKDDSEDRQEDSAFCNQFMIPGNTEDISQNTITSSLKEIDMYSFTESTRQTEQENHSSSLHSSHKRNEPSDPLPTEQNGVTKSESIIHQDEHTESSNPTEISNHISSVPPEKFYKDLLSQVNNLLKSSSAEDENSSTKYYSQNASMASENVTEESIPSKQPDNDSNTVLKATLKQLKNLGVNLDMDTSDLQTTNADTSDSASILACINPEAVVSRLNYVSLTNIGLSGFVPNGVDLSMEANAIALKYLSESQLTQLSLSHANKDKQTDMVYLNSLVSGNTEKSMVGLSLISPSNMSFATKKYMKRYGLIESNDSSVEEQDLPSESNFSLQQTQGNTLDKNRRLFPDHSPNNELLDIREGPGRKQKDSGVDSNHEWIHHPEANKLKNITNEILTKCVNPEPFEEKPLHFLKDLKAKTKFSSGKVQFTRHPEKENPQLFHGEDPNIPGKRNLCSPGRVGDILDVNRLRQLPKLF